jgi:pimeloyl-ACP methyl ester carboxylesterase
VPFNHNTWANAVSDFQLKPDKTIDDVLTEPGVVATFASNCWRYDGEASPNGGRRDLRVDTKVRLIPTASIQAPTLLIVGDRDPAVTVPLCEEALKTLKGEGSQLKVIHGAAHAMMMEKPHYKEFRESVLAFLK